MFTVHDVYDGFTYDVMGVTIQENELHQDDTYFLIFNYSGIEGWHWVPATRFAPGEYKNLGGSDNE